MQYIPTCNNNVKKKFFRLPKLPWHVRRGKKKKRAFTRKRNKTFFSVPDHFLKRQCFCSVARAYSWQSAALVLLGKARRERETKEQTATTKQAEVKWVKREKANVSLSFFFSCSELCAYGVRSKGWMQTNEQLKSTKKRAWAKNDEAALWYLKKKKMMYGKTNVLATCTPLSQSRENQT